MEFIALSYLILLFVFLFGISLDFGIEKEFDYVWTTAICEGNECRDFQVTCLNGEVKEMIPLTGLVTFPSDWEDLRGEVKICN